LIEKWKEKGRNKIEPNIQMIVAEACDEQPRIKQLCGGMRTRVDVIDQGNRIHQWVRKATEPLPLFDPRKEKETYQQERK
jgi:hypothetical protein